jgi:hypothetical protein
MTTYIVFAGRKHSGKSTAASWIDSRGYHLLSLADPLKLAVRELFGLEYFQVNGPGKEVPDPFWGLTPREILQKLGTEGLRALFGDDFHLRRLELEVQKERFSHVVVDDCRFPNEAQWFREKGALVIGIHRPALDVIPADSHDSEQFADLAVLEANCDLVITNPAPLIGLNNAWHRPIFLDKVMGALSKQDVELADDGILSGEREDGSEISS